MRRLLTVLVVSALALVATPAHAEEPEDLTPPDLQMTPMAGGVGGWYADTATVFVKATDPGPISSGVRLVSWQLSGATTGSGTVEVTCDSRAAPADARGHVLVARGLGDLRCEERLPDG